MKHVINTIINGCLILEELPSIKYTNREILAKCICGNTFKVKLNSLKTGNTRSCGCVRKEKSRQLCLSRATHSKKGTRIYRIWQSMKARATGKADRDRYFNRGITCDPRWLSFAEFYFDMGEAPANCSLDRIDNNAGYCKSNCRWATHEQQCNNKESNIYCYLWDFKYSMSQACRILGLSKSAVNSYRKYHDISLE